MVDENQHPNSNFTLETSFPKEIRRAAGCGPATSSPRFLDGSFSLATGSSTPFRLRVLSLPFPNLGWCTTHIRGVETVETTNSNGRTWWIPQIQRHPKDAWTCIHLCHPIFVRQNGCTAPESQKVNLLRFGGQVCHTWTIPEVNDLYLGYISQDISDLFRVITNLRTIHLLHGFHTAFWLAKSKCECHEQFPSHFLQASRSPMWCSPG